MIGVIGAYKSSGQNWVTFQRKIIIIIIICEVVMQRFFSFSGFVLFYFRVPNLSSSSTKVRCASRILVQKV